ncbi:MAG: hypothetical protein EON58_08825 [Alphaproteobacteria bacterium]|nr:MAG: hypothetical protein EON58_08825 [Alphaproteobacteria bacterium]
MEIHGYSNKGLAVEEIRSEPLSEITLVASPAELRKIAEFLVGAAESMERMGDTYSHEHLSDKQSGFDKSPHFVVFNPDATS